MEKRELICIGCPMGCPLTVTLDGGAVVTVQGNTCPRGDAYARKEVTAPDAHCDHNGARDRRHPARRELQDPQRHPEGENF